MDSRIMAICGVLAFLTGPARGGQPPFVTVELATPRDEYLLGEPVPFEIEITNILGHEFSWTRPEGRYIEMVVSPLGVAHVAIDEGEGGVGDFEGKVQSLGRDEISPYHVWVFQKPHVVDGEFSDYESCFPGPGDYAVTARFPLSASATLGDHLLKTFRNVASNTLVIHIKRPTGDDATIFEAISDRETREFLQTGRYPKEGMGTIRNLVKILTEHPETGYRHAIRHALLEFNRQYPSNPDAKESEPLRLVLGLPDRRFFPDDPRLDRKVSLDFPDGAPIQQIFNALRRQVGVPLSASPYFYRNRSDDETKFGMQDCPLREAMLTLAHDFLTTSPVEDPSHLLRLWVRRGDGYHLYYETLNETPTVRKGFIDQLGPLPVLFPEDKRLDAMVVAVFPMLTPIDQVFASYSAQSGVKFHASAYIARCRKRGDVMFLNLREEMAYLARTFDATWERHADGYVLSAGEDADRNVPPPEKVEEKGSFILLGALATLGIVFTAKLDTPPDPSNKASTFALLQVATAVNNEICNVMGDNGTVTVNGAYALDRDKNFTSPYLNGITMGPFAPALKGINLPQDALRDPSMPNGPKYRPDMLDDSPSLVQLTGLYKQNGGDYAVKFSENISFATYLMYKATDRGLWVGISEIRWSVSGTAALIPEVRADGFRTLAYYENIKNWNVANVLPVAGQPQVGGNAFVIPSWKGVIPPLVKGKCK